MIQDQQIVPQKTSEKTGVQWRLNAELLQNAEFHAITLKTSVRELVELYLETLPRYSLAMQSEVSSQNA